MAGSTAAVTLPDPAVVPIANEEPPLLRTDTAPPDKGALAELASVTVSCTVGNVTSVPCFTLTPDNVFVVPPRTTRKS